MSMRVRRIVVLVTAAAMSFALLVSLASPARGATITVTTTADELNADGDCSLREAIDAADADAAVDACAAGSGSDVVTVGAGTYQLADALDDLRVDSSMTIDGVGAGSTTISGADDRVLRLNAGPDATAVTISDLTITGGIANTGAGVKVRPGVTLTMTNVVVTGNVASNGSAHGNGIYVQSPSGPQAGAIVNLVNTDVTANTGGSQGGGIFVDQGGTLNVTGGTISENNSASGGGIWADGTVSLTDATVHDNFASGALGSGEGGGVWAGGTVTIAGSTISSNDTTGQGAGIFAELGATVTITGTTIGTQNVAAEDGGGLFNRGAAVDISGSVISGNSASGTGGGIANERPVIITEVTELAGFDVRLAGEITPPPGGDLTIDTTTISGNTAAGNGGGIANGATLAVDASTISGNTGRFGGGLYVAPGAGAVALGNSTISGNSATEQGGGIATDSNVSLAFSTISRNQSGVGAAVMVGSEVATVELFASIVAANPGEECGAPFGGAFLSLGSNLSSDATCNLTQPSDQQGVGDVGLADLAANGGPTQTHALEPGSPAIDAVQLAPLQVCVATDQRGVARPQDGDDDGAAACDIGAFELAATTGGGSPGAGSPSPTASQLPDTASNSGTVGAGGVPVAALLAATASAACAVALAKRRARVG
jgi:CSLREA domain-containing protein